MSPELMAVMLGAALLHATWNVIVKGGTNKVFEIALNSLGGGLGVLAALPFLPLPDRAAWPLLATSTSIHLAYYLCISAAYRRSDLSYAYTLMRGSAPLLTSIALALMGTPLSAGGWLGVALISGGVLTLATDNLRHGRFDLTGTLAALGTAVVIMGYTLADGYGARASGNPLSYVAWIFFCNALPLNLYVFFRHGGTFRPYFRKRGLPGILGGLCGLGSYGIALWAMTKAPIALVAALRETSVIFGMLLAVFFLKEKLTAARIAAVTLVAAGGIAIRTL